MTNSVLELILTFLFIVVFAGITGLAILANKLESSNNKTPRYEQRNYD